MTKGTHRLAVFSGQSKYYWADSDNGSTMVLQDSANYKYSIKEICMWKCKHCNQEFNFTRLTDKANHGKHCDYNPKKKESYKKMAEANRKRYDYDLGEYKKFDVKCNSCNSRFLVNEREKCFPSKTRYFCSRSCANSIGGKAKAEKYGVIGYITIAERFYKKQCAVCGIDDILDVHHIDENRENCHPSNLIFLCPNDHYRLHRNKDGRIKKVIEGHGTAWGGHFFCKEDVSWVQIPDAPPEYFLD